VPLGAGEDEVFFRGSAVDVHQLVESWRSATTAASTSAAAGSATSSWSRARSRAACARIAAFFAGRCPPGGRLESLAPARARARCPASRSRACPRSRSPSASGPPRCGPWARRLRGLRTLGVCARLRYLRHARERRLLGRVPRRGHAAAARPGGR
jgi:hypothetical protein